VVSHPAEWCDGGYAELQSARRRYNVIDRRALLDLLGLTDQVVLKRSRQQWVDVAGENSAGASGREVCWTESLAVGSADFVRCVQGALGQKGSDRQIQRAEAGFVLREEELGYEHILPSRRGC
jgi:hypothetical protein